MSYVSRTAAPIAVALAALTLLSATAARADDLARWRAEAQRVTITRDDWGIAHVRGHTDADAVFGMIYAQAEDDFSRVEWNYVTSLGRTAEALGEKAVWADLRQKLVTDPADLKARYAQSPAWLRALMDSWADGLNFYLATHPKVQPKVIRRFEPWMALAFTEGSIGPDIEKAPLDQLGAFYGNPQVAAALPHEDPQAVREPSGSNGIAIGPQITQDGHALLLINPHTSFFFRSELQMQSDEGLDAYGAVTWGQFFVYQGFNAQAGWMHTSTGADVVDEFAETIARRNGRLFYRYGAEERPVTVRTVAVSYRAADGGLASRSFTTFATHHGPIIRAEGGKWIALALMQKPVEALEQSFGRTKTTDLASFLKIAELAANSSNNTLFADSKGETAFLLPQFVPRRDNRFDYMKPVDGSDPATDWHGLHTLADTPHVISPKAGWAYNSNDEPWRAAGPDSPKKADFPRYMDKAGWNPRGPHAERVLKDRKDFTLDRLIAAAFDPYLPAFARLVPELIAAYDSLGPGDPFRVELAEPIALLRAWDDRWGLDSTATSLANVWGEVLWDEVSPAAPPNATILIPALEAAPPIQKLDALEGAVQRMTHDYGSWRVPWGQINRFQRLDDSIQPHFDDARPSVGVPFTSAQWGSLAAFGVVRDGTRKYYGVKGNSFVAAVEFGPRVRARAVSTGGESGDPASPHFGDQAGRYVAGDLREVWFYPDQLAAHTKRTYRPGE
jgi:acyl-homoserine-lactone acylase